MANSETAYYRFDGPKDKMKSLGSIDLSALTKDTDHEQGVVTAKGIASLTEAEVKELRAAGASLTKLDDEQSKKYEEELAAGQTDILTKRGADQTDPEAVLAARAAQQESQGVEKTTPTPAESSGSSGNQGGTSRQGNQGGAKSSANS